MHRKQVIHAHFFVHIKVRFFLLPQKTVEISISLWYFQLSSDEGIY